MPQYTSYQVWRYTQPYFSPDDVGPELRGTVPTPAPGTELVTYDDAGAIGDVDLNYFYVVRGINAAGTTGDSNRIGEFDFALVPGS